MILQYLARKIAPLSERFFRTKAVRKFAQTYPRLFKFVTARLTIKKITGLPASLLVVVILLNAFLLSEIVEDVVNAPVTRRFDMNISQWFFRHRADAITTAFLAITQLGIREVVIVISVVTLTWMLVKKQWAFFFGLLISVTGSSAAMYYSKLFFKRKRPDGLGVQHLLTYSFPSGHATAAMALYGFIFFYLICMVKSTNARWAIFISGAVLVFLLGLSRIYLGVHFFTDVVAGYSLGLIWLLMGISLVAYKMIRTAPEHYGGVSGKGREKVGSH